MKKLFASLSFAALLLPALAAAAQCPNITEDMWLQSCDESLTDSDCERHTTGNQVSSLQAFLKDYFTNPAGLWVSGYFGGRTERYVKQFQEQWDVRTTGYVGPLTRRAIVEACTNTTTPPTPPPSDGNCTSPWGTMIPNGRSVVAYRNYEVETFPRQNRCVSETRYCRDGTLSGSYTDRACTGGTNPEASMTVEPRSGRAPLTVTFTPNIQIAGPLVADAPAHRIEFGDGLQETLHCATPEVVGSCLPAPVEHRYTTVGTYIVRLVSFGGYCPGACPETTLFETRIYVNGSETNNSSCTTPWGSRLEHGGSVSAYQVQSVESGSTCESVRQTRTCNNGSLSGSYQYRTCSVAGGGTTNSCVTPWNTTIENGGRVTAYQSPSSNSTQECVSQTRTCQNGTLSGTYQYETCTSYDTGLYSWVTGEWGSCSREQQTRTVQCRSNGGTVVADSYCSGTKPATTQSCSNTLPPSSGVSCTAPWGATIVHGGSVTAYQAASPDRLECVSQTRTCNNGVLSGSYQYGSCTVGGNQSSTQNQSQLASALVALEALLKEMLSILR